MPSHNLSTAAHEKSFCRPELESTRRAEMMFNGRTVGGASFGRAKRPLGGVAGEEELLSGEWLQGPGDKNNANSAGR